MKNNLLVPVILSIIIVLAGVNVFIPIEQARALHSTIIESLEAAIQEIIPQVLGPISGDVADLDADHDQISTDIADAFNADKDKDPANENQTLSTTGGDVVLGTTEAGDGGGTVTCAEITGDASLCDSNDAVDDGDTSSSNEDQTLTFGFGGAIPDTSFLEFGVLLSTTESGDGGGYVPCSTITHSLDLCDGDDDSGLKIYKVTSGEVNSGSGVFLGKAACDSEDIAFSGGISGDMVFFTYFSDGPELNAANPNVWVIGGTGVENRTAIVHAWCLDSPPFR